MTVKRIAFQGEPGAFSDAACQQFDPTLTPLPCATFDRVFAAVASGEAAAAMVPIENAIAGRVDDVYRLLPDMKMSIVSEHFLPIEMQLMTLPDTDPAAIRSVRSHPMALGQCRSVINRLGLLAETAGDTAGAAKALSESREAGVAVIAPAVAATRYGLKIVETNVQDADRNYTRFFKLMPEDQVEWPDLLSGPTITSIVFRVRNIPAALYKSMGGFATNGVNMIKLESYQEDATFRATRFQAEFEGHPDEPSVRRALEELGYFSSDMRLLGVFPSAPYRASQTLIS